MERYLRNEKLVKLYAAIVLAACITIFLGAFIVLLVFAEIPKENASVVYYLGGNFTVGFAAVCYYFFKYAPDQKKDSNKDILPEEGTGFDGCRYPQCGGSVSRTDKT